MEGGIDKNTYVELEIGLKIVERGPVEVRLEDATHVLRLADP